MNNSEMFSTLKSMMFPYSFHEKVCSFYIMRQEIKSKEERLSGKCCTGQRNKNDSNFHLSMATQEVLGELSGTPIPLDLALPHSC